MRLVKREFGPRKVRFSNSPHRTVKHRSLQGGGGKRLSETGRPRLHGDRTGGPAGHFLLSFFLLPHPHFFVGWLFREEMGRGGGGQGGRFCLVLPCQLRARPVLDWILLGGNESPFPQTGGGGDGIFGAGIDRNNIRGQNPLTSRNSNPCPLQGARLGFFRAGRAKPVSRIGWGS